MRTDRVGPQSVHVPRRPSSSARAGHDEAPGTQAPQDTVDAAKPALKEWTVLGFFNGNNDLEPYVTQGVIAAETVGPNPNLSFVAQLARAPEEIGQPEGGTRAGGDWVGVRRYESRFSGVEDEESLRAKLVETLPDDTDMGATDTLADFLRWGIKNYPAKHYMVIVNNHGAGFLGVSYDDIHHSHLDPDELSDVLSQVRAETGVKPDVLLFDACEMAQAEVAYELRNDAGYLVGSEELIGAPGLPYPEILALPAFDDDVSGRTLAAHIVEASAADQVERMDDEDDDAALQLSAIDLAKMGDLRDACDQLSEALRADGISRTRLAGIVKRTKKFSGRSKAEHDFRDLGDFATRLLHSRQLKSEAVRVAAQGVLDALDKTVIAHQNEGEGMARTHGMSVYLPTDGGRDPLKPHKRDPFHYLALDMSHEGQWPDLIAHIHPPPGP